MVINVRVIKFCFTIIMLDKLIITLHSILVCLIFYMKIHYKLLGFISLLSFVGCNSFKNSSKYQITDGYYNSAVFSAKHKKVYLTKIEDHLTIYKINQINKDQIDSSSELPRNLPIISSGKMSRITLSNKSFDIDFITIAVKYRFPIGNFPQQLNSNINGAVYLGLRNDIFHVKYKSGVIGPYQRSISHFGFSVGGILGLGSTAMNPWVTNDKIAIEYDGLVWMKGIVGILAIDNLSIGLSLGWDQLLDENKKDWIYNNNPWVGIGLGLNLN